MHRRHRAGRSAGMSRADPDEGEGRAQADQPDAAVAEQAGAEGGDTGGQDEGAGDRSAGAATRRRSVPAPPRAAMGVSFDARRAGTVAATSVTSSPTTIDDRRWCGA